MKKKLLYLASIALFSVLSVNAQTKTWNFSTLATWPLTSGNGAGIDGTSTAPYTEAVNDQLGLYVAAAPTTIVNFGAVNASNATFPDGLVRTTRFQLNGGGYTSGTGFLATPVQRHVYFNVDGACTVKVWFKTGSNGSVRTVFVTDGTNTLGSGVSNTSGTTDLVVFTANVVAAGKIYVFADASCNLYQIEVTGANVNTPSLSTDSFQAGSSVVVYANDGAINVSNVTSATKVSVYSVLGSLVKSIETSEDTSVAINAGVYVVKAQSAEGTKTTKVIVQ